MLNTSKCAIIGCGFVGAACAYSLSHSGIFSEMVLIDKSKKKAQGEAMDIADAMPFLSPAKIYCGDYPDTKDCAIIIIAAGHNQRKGETRLELVRKNTEILKEIVGEIIKYNTDCILLVVTNPVDILTYVTLKLSGFPASRVIGSGTVLDTARLKQEIGDHLSVDPRNVHTFVIGEHGDSELSVFSSANISGIDLSSFCKVCNYCDGMQKMYGLFENVRDSAYSIIEAKGATSYGIAEAVNRICTAIMRNENAILPVSVYLDGQYGLDGLCLGIPSLVGRTGVKHIFEIPLDKYESERLKRSAEIISNMISELEIEELPVV